MPTDPPAGPARCTLCARLLDNPRDMPDSADCGGDCRRCLADLGDPHERRAMGWPAEEEG